MAQSSTILSESPTIFDDQYEIICPVGRGRNSVVYQAVKLGGRDPKRTGKNLVALKVLVGNAKDPDVHIKRMKREALAMLSCVHRNVIKLNDYSSKGDLCYLAMEYAERGDLRQMLDAQQVVFTPDLVLRLMVQILSGLEKIHSVGIVHRDVKPENVLLTRDCVIKLADFGISCLPTEKVLIEEANRGIGTFDYLAPECLEEGLSNQATDIYSAAVTCYQLLTGHMPFGGTSFTEQIANKMDSRITPLSNFVKDVPPLLQEFMEKSLACDIDTRFKTALEFKAAIESYLAGNWSPDSEYGAAPIPSQEVDIRDRETNGHFGTAAIHPFPRTQLVRDKAIGKEAEECVLPWDDEEQQEPDYSGVDQIQDDGDQIQNDNEQIQNDSEQEFTGDLNVLQNREPSSLYAFLRCLRWLSTPRRLAVLVVLCAAVWFAVLKDTSYLAPSLTRIIEPILAAVNDTGGAKPSIGSTRPRDFASLANGNATGLIYGLFADGEDISILTVPVDGSKKVMVFLASGGWEPVIIDIKALHMGESLQVAGGGIKLVLTLDRADGPEGSKLSGTYKEYLSGREGNWAIW
jgi:serine/threonine protein kinase